MLESLFNKVAGLHVFCCEYCKIFKSSSFYRTPPVVASADVLFYIIFSKRRSGYIVVIHCIIALFQNQKSLSFASIHFHSLCSSFSFAVPLIVTRCHSLSVIVTRFHSLSFIVTRHSLSLLVTRCTTRCHSLYYLLSFFAIRCTTRSHFLSIVFSRCHSLYNSLLLNLPLVCLFINGLFFIIMFNVLHKKDFTSMEDNRFDKYRDIIITIQLLI